ncbi:tetratricopeptide repeat protein [Halodesulfovibrio marinisediminis]|uniref:Flp pilus assembly protein TadD, contains TPR repeats n=1 Tax=Halodesulfovibrio marinisediminis DSM 17456 TaxID=1121457 RepID=A0A1N6EA70_9BACT|nr:tetratricopeptide repeat protein [Halodesulfovibrio marinisediminis]SIN79861.1 Flp pilus assembly protein TadD, contains TPR repeats [Halodesulfovibrio marinisediminis DSM 17456]
MRTAWGVFSVILLCFGLLLTGCKKNIESSASMQEWLEEHDPKEEMTWQAYVREGDQYAAQENLEQAYMQYSKALHLQPENLELRVKRGDILFRKKLMEKALVEYTAVLEKEADRHDANLGVGKVYFAVNDHDKAAEHLEKASGGGCMYWEADAIMGIISDYNGDPLEGENFFLEALRCEPNNGDVLNNLGTCYLLQGKHAEAVDAFINAIKAGNTKKRVYNNLGIALVKTERYQEAFEAFRMSASEAVAYNNIGYIYYLLQNYDKAVKCFEKAISMHSAYYAEADENLKRAKAALFSKKIDNSQPEFEQHQAYSTNIISTDSALQETNLFE